LISNNKYIHISSVIGTTVSVESNSKYHTKLITEGSIPIIIDSSKYNNNNMPLPYKSKVPVIYHGNNKLISILENVSD